jgi:biotin synthase
MQALCFLCGANSIFYGERLLTTGNPDVERDQQLFARLGIRPESVPGTSSTEHAVGLNLPEAPEPALTLRGTAFKAAACTQRGQGGL